MRKLTLSLFAVAWLGCHQQGGAATAAASASASAPREPIRVTGAEAQKLVADGAWLVDVRTPDEYNQLHLDGARNIPLAELSEKITTLPKDKPVVVYCAVGARSAKAAAMLAQAGLDVRNLGAMENWKQ